MKYELKEYVVAFIDVLGTSERIKTDSESSLNIVHAVYDKALDTSEELYSNANIRDLKPLVKIYSDNIVVAVPIRDEDPFVAFASVVIFSGVIQRGFLNYGYLVRGGVAMGEFFADQTMLWGQALIDSYYIENNIAIYPRIVIHPDVVVELKLAINQARQKWIPRPSDYFFRW